MKGGWLFEERNKLESKTPAVTKSKAPKIHEPKTVVKNKSPDQRSKPKENNGSVEWKLNELVPLKREPSPSAASFDNNDSGDDESKASPEWIIPPKVKPADP